MIELDKHNMQISCTSIYLLYVLQAFTPINLFTYYILFFFLTCCGFSCCFCCCCWLFDKFAFCFVVLQFA